MTRKEVLIAVRIKEREMKVCMATLDYMLVSLVEGYRPEPEGSMDEVSALLDTIKIQAEDVKVILKQWGI